MLGELLNILMYDIAMYTRANIEKTANSQVRLDARSDYMGNFLTMGHIEQFPVPQFFLVDAAAKVVRKPVSLKTVWYRRITMLKTRQVVVHEKISSNPIIKIDQKLVSLSSVSIFYSIFRTIVLHFFWQQLDLFPCKNRI